MAQEGASTAERTARSPVLALACDLLARPSVTPQDGGCQDRLAEYLRDAGFTAQRFDRNGVRNILLRHGHARPLLVFAGHTDVVPTGPLEAWSSPPFEPCLRDGLLLGRGAADMKSSLAAFAVAARSFVLDRPDHPGSVALLLTSDEEGPSVDGTVAVVEALRARGETVDFCIVGEPTCTRKFGDTVKNGRRGSLSARLLVRGIQGHVAYPSLARNPIHDFAPVLEALVAARWDEGTPDFPPTSFQISNLHAGTGAGNVIPGRLELDCNFRFSPASPPERLRLRVESLLYSHEIDFDIEWTLGAEPYLCGPGPLLECLRQAIVEETGIEPQTSTSGGTSDGRFLARICPQVAEFGPCNGTIHKVDESIRVDEIDALERVYRRTLEKVLVEYPAVPAFANVSE